MDRMMKFEQDTSSGRGRDAAEIRFSTILGGQSFPLRT
jgi:hypothetical protein